MTSSNGNIFRATGPLCWEFTGHRWIPLTKANDAEPWCFLWSAPEQTKNIRSAHYDAVRHALGNKLQWNANQIMMIFIQENELENIFKTAAIYFYVLTMAILELMTPLRIPDKSRPGHLITNVANRCSGAK